ncbi:hypothetical protein TNCV_2593771 [Trichonephila clavipes]|nr:hypothetical protein TNCV_2593771 [Trichonephila clavipes]
MADLFENHWAVSTAMDICSTISISELTTREAKRRDHHAQSTCLEIPGPNSHVHTFINEMGLRPVETPCGTVQCVGATVTSSGSTSCTKTICLSESS